MKCTLHISVGNYEFVEVEVDSGDIRSEYDYIKSQFVVGEGLDTKTFNAVLDEYLATGKVKNGVELWEKMNQFQQGVFQEIKKSFKRKEFVAEVNQEVLADKI